MIGLNPSPVESIEAFGMRLFLKRDDRLHPDFSGNKARKFYYWLRREFPHVRRILSYGSVQSNAMASLSVLARMRGWALHYYVDHIPSWLRKNPVGNYRKALENGTRFFVGEALPPLDEETLRIEEGGRQSEAEEGIALLAAEIEAWRRKRGIGSLRVFLPSGTGTTALYLQKQFRLRHLTIEVVTTPLGVGGESGPILKKPVCECVEVGNRRFWPGIIPEQRRYHIRKGQTEIWAFGLMRTTGWVVFLYPRVVGETEGEGTTQGGGKYTKESPRGRKNLWRQR